MITGTFGQMDLIFAGHPSDSERAFELLKECRNVNLGMEDLLEEVKKHLVNKEAGDEHVVEQLKKVELMFSGWIE